MVKTGRGVRNIAIVAILIALIGITTGFMALQQILNIEGVTTIRGVTWDIHFANLSNPVINGTAQIDAPATLTRGTAMSFAISLDSPNDSVSYEFDIVNNGNISARINSVDLSGVNAAIAQNIFYTLTYVDGSQINVDDVFNPGDSRRLRLTVRYDNVPEILNRNITLNLGATIIFVQN